MVRLYATYLIGYECRLVIAYLGSNQLFNVLFGWMRFACVQFESYVFFISTVSLIWWANNKAEMLYNFWCSVSFVLDLIPRMELNIIFLFFFRTVRATLHCVFVYEARAKQQQLPPPTLLVFLDLDLFLFPFFAFISVGRGLRRIYTIYIFKCEPCLL